MQEALIDDVLDEAQLMRTVEGDRTLLRELAVLFLEELPAHLAAIRSAVGQRNATTLQAAAHALKGAAATFAAGRVAAVSGRLEWSGISAACAGAVPMLAELEANVGELQPRLIALTGDPS